MFKKKISNFISYAKILSRTNKSVLVNPANWDNSLINPTEFYLDAFRFFYFNLPSKIREHKYYFNKKARGFGEKAFHTMWYLLYNKYNFKNFLEIGIYRGQIICLLGLVSKMKNKEITINGISPFDNSADTVSNYIQIDYLEDVYKNFEKFSLDLPLLTKAFSTDQIAKDVISSTLWDCIYIDGSHEYEIAKKDWLICSQYVKVGGIIVMDDSSLFTKFNPPFFAFKGHPGPSKVADEIIENANFKEILRVGHNRVFERIN